MQNTYRLGIILVLLSSLVWSTAGVYTRLISIDTASMLFWRGAFAGLGLLVAVALIQGRAGLRRLLTMNAASWLFALVSALGMVCFMYALRLSTVAHVAIIYATAPLIAAGLGWLILRERLSKAALYGSLAALLGVVLMVGFGGDGDIVGDILALAMTAALAVMAIISRSQTKVAVLPAAAISGLLTSLFILPAATQFTPSIADMWYLASFGLVNSALGLALFTIGARMLPAAETMLIGALDAPLAPLWVWILFAETPTAMTLLGGAVVALAIAGYLVSSTWQADRSA